MRILSLSIVVSICAVVVVSQPLAGRRREDQIVFGDTFPPLSDDARLADNSPVDFVYYPPELLNHVAMRFDPRKHYLVDTSQPGSVVSRTKQEQVEDYLNQLDIWTTLPDGQVEAHFLPEQFEAFRNMMARKGIPEQEGEWVVLEQDLQQVADQQAKVLNRAMVAEYDAKLQMSINEQQEYDYNEFFKEWRKYDQIKAFYERMATDFSDVVTLIPSIGKTFEGRDIFAIKITAGGDNKLSEEELHSRPQIWWQGGQHAREWVGISTVAYLAHHYASNFAVDESITDILQQVELVIVPVMNVDGFMYTWESNRMHRKNRRPVGYGMFGVDLNRNWDEKWGQGGSSNLPWSETYRGTAPNSEPEVQALSAFFGAQKRIVAAIDFHCYSQLILRPLGWSSKPSEHEKEHKLVGDKMAELIKNVSGKQYVSEPSMSLYKTTGAASDWFYGENATLANGGQRVYSYTIELRPNDQARGGFVLPAEEIIPVGKEITAAMEWFVPYVIKHPLE